MYKLFFVLIIDLQIFQKLYKRFWLINYKEGLSLFNTQVPTQVNTSQHKSGTSQHKSNTSQHESYTSQNESARVHKSSRSDFSQNLRPIKPWSITFC